MSNTHIHSDNHDADRESQRPQAAEPASQRAPKPELRNAWLGWSVIRPSRGYYGVKSPVIAQGIVATSPDLLSLMP